MHFYKLHGAWTSFSWGFGLGFGGCHRPPPSPPPRPPGGIGDSARPPNSVTTYLCAVPWRPDKFLSRASFWRVLLVRGFIRGRDARRATSSSRAEIPPSLSLRKIVGFNISPRCPIRSDPRNSVSAFSGGHAAFSQCHFRIPFRATRKFRYLNVRLFFTRRREGKKGAEIPQSGEII